MRPVPSRRVEAVGASVGPQSAAWWLSWPAQLGQANFGHAVFDAIFRFAPLDPSISQQGKRSSGGVGQLRGGDPIDIAQEIEKLAVILIEDRDVLCLLAKVLQYCLKRGFCFHNRAASHRTLMSSYKRSQLFLNGFQAFSRGMDHEDLSTGFVPAFRRSYARLAAWMTRENRASEPSRSPAPPRIEWPARFPDPPRRPTPPRI